jgi:hypothetical protein
LDSNSNASQATSASNPLTSLIHAFDNRIDLKTVEQLNNISIYIHSFCEWISEV